MRPSIAVLFLLSTGALVACGDDGDSPSGPSEASVERTEVVYGDAQLRLPGTPLADELIAVGVDSNGDRVEQAGLSVSAQVTGGGGSVTLRSTTTDSGGLAYLTWELGQLGAQGLNVSIGGSQAAAFTAEAVLAGPILFASDRNPLSQEWDLYAMDPDGGNVVPLTVGPARDRDASWSPDGSSVLFERFAAPENIMQMSLTDLVPVPFPFQDPEAGSFVWSPDGAQVAFSIKQSGGTDCTRAEHNVWLMNADGSDAERVTDSPCGTANKFPTWSPDGSMLAYESEEGQPCCSAASVWTMSADGSNAAQVSEELGYFPQWMPDGQHIVVGGFSGEPTAALRIINVQTGDDRTIWTPPEASDYVLPGGVSPDGKYAVAEVGLRGLDSEVFRIDLETGEGVNLTNRPDRFDGFPMWRPGPSGGGE